MSCKVMHNMYSYALAQNALYFKNQTPTTFSNKFNKIGQYQ